MNYVALLRGVNVGGKNTIAMSELRSCLEGNGFAEVSTFLNSGNVLFSAAESAELELAQKIERLLIKNFQFDSDLIKVLVLSAPTLQAVVNKAPKGFGTQPGTYHTDVAFLINYPVDEAMQQVEVNPAVDAAWQGDRVIYYQRLSAERTKSRLGKVIGKPVYKSMTIRTFNTVRKLLERCQPA